MEKAEALKRLTEKFTSSNSIMISNARITREEFKAIIGPDPKLYYVINDYGHGDSGRVKENLTEEEAIDLFNKETANDMKSLPEIEFFDHPVTSIRQMGH